MNGLSNMFLEFISIMWVVIFSSWVSFPLSYYHILTFYVFLNAFVDMYMIIHQL